MRSLALLLVLTATACADKSDTGTAVASPGAPGGTPAGGSTSTGTATSAGSTTSGGTPTATVPGTPTGTTTTTPGAQVCANAAATPGYLDTLQTPYDGMVIFCHMDQAGVYHYLNIPVMDCLPHGTHAQDLLPSTICNS